MSGEERTDVPAKLALTLGASHVEVRRDLEIMRRVVRGQVSYVVLDPITRATHRFTTRDYGILAAISLREDLAGIFADLVRAKRLGRDDEDRFYQFIVSLHRRGLLHLSVFDAKTSDRRDPRKLVPRSAVRTLGWLAMLGVPLALLAIPIRSNVRAPGIVQGRDEAVVRAEVSGFLSATAARAGQSIDLGGRLIELEDPTLAVRLADVDSRLESSRLRRSQHLGTNLMQVKEEDARAIELEHERAMCERDVSSLSVRSSARGTIVACLKPNDVGRFVQRGEAIATVSGPLLTVRALLSEGDLADAQPLVGQSVEFRSRCEPTRTWHGTIERIVSQHQSRAVFEFEVSLDEASDAGSHIHGATGDLLLRGTCESIGMRVWRDLILFTRH